MGYNISRINRKYENINLDELLSKKINNTNPIVFDVGGNKGQSVEKFKTIFKDPIIHSFEPNKNVYDIMYSKFGKDEKVFCNNFALGNKIEERNFQLPCIIGETDDELIEIVNKTTFQDLENLTSDNNAEIKVSKKTDEEQLPGSSQPQDLGTISYKDTATAEKTQKIESVETTASIVTETFQAEEKILPEAPIERQYAFATSFLKNGDYTTAERAFREFVLTNPEHELAGNAQYWYAETFRIRQLYTDAASAYLEGYQKYPRGEKAPINLLKLGVSMVQIGEKDQGCKMINGVENQYPDANQSVIQKAKYESQKFECSKQNS